MSCIIFHRLDTCQLAVVTSPKLPIKYYYSLNCDL